MPMTNDRFFDIVGSVLQRCLEVLNEKGPDYAGEDNRLEGTVRSAVYMGNYLDYQVEVGEVRLRVQAKPSTPYREGDRVGLVLRPEACVCIPGPPEGG